MSTSLNAVAVSSNREFQNRVAHYVQKAAVAVMSELATEPNHAERVAYANKVLQGEVGVTEYTVAVCTNATIFAALNPQAEDRGVTDSDLEFTVNSMFNAFAGVAT